MIEPSKLIAGVSAVYGADYVKKVYGEILPIPAERIIEAPDDTRISLNGRYQNIGYIRTMLSGVTTPLANAGRRLVTV